MSFEVGTRCGLTDDRLGVAIGTASESVSASASASASIAAPAPKASDPLQAYKDEQEAQRQLLQALTNGGPLLSLADAGFPLTGGGSGKPSNPPPHLGPPPKPDVAVGVTSSDVVPNAQRTVSNMRSGFRACYSKGLESDPKMTGRLRLRTKISPFGAVTSVTTETNAGLSTDVEQCVTKRIRTAAFDATGDEATIIVTLVFRMSYDDLGL